MTHEECLNKLLMDSCKTPSDKDPGFDVFTIELHCSMWEITARYLGDGKYEIKSTEKVSVD